MGFKIIDARFVDMHSALAVSYSVSMVQIPIKGKEQL